MQSRRLYSIQFLLITEFVSTHHLRMEIAKGLKLKTVNLLGRSDITDQLMDILIMDTNILTEGHKDHGLKLDTLMS